MTTSTDEVREEDRLPWLETVDEDYDDSPSMLRMIAFVAIGLLVIAAVMLGIYWLRNSVGAPTPGKGTLIAAPATPYKVKPETPGGMKVDGTGDVAFATSEGNSTAGGTINLAGMPEAPVEGKHASGAATAKKGTTVNAVPAVGTPLRTPSPAAQPKINVAAGAVSGGSLVQLGAFPTAAAADAAWSAMAKRFAYLAPLGKAVQPAEVDGRKTFRLRVNAGSADQAAQLCGKLKVAGEACFVAQN